MQFSLAFNLICMYTVSWFVLNFHLAAAVAGRSGTVAKKRILLDSDDETGRVKVTRISLVVVVTAYHHATALRLWL